MIMALILQLIFETYMASIFYLWRFKWTASIPSGRQEEMKINDAISEICAPPPLLSQSSPVQLLYRERNDTKHVVNIFFLCHSAIT